MYGFWLVFVCFGVIVHAQVTVSLYLIVSCVFVLEQGEELRMDLGRERGRGGEIKFWQAGRRSREGMMKSLLKPNQM